MEDSADARLVHDDVMEQPTSQHEKSTSPTHDRNGTISRRHFMAGGTILGLATMAGCSASNSTSPSATGSAGSTTQPVAPTSLAPAATGAVPIVVDDDVLFWPAHRQLASLDAGEFTSSELTEAYLERIERINAELSAFVHVDAAGAREAAAAADQRRASGDRTPVLGLCVGIKDLIEVAGLPVTYGSRIFEGNIASEDAPAVARLRAAGAVILGKVNTTEFALSSPSTLDGPSLNPWAFDRTAGGSSNGSGTAAAAGLCSFSVGTDTAGSIRTPAAFQGVFGLKPSHGRVSTEGVGVLSSYMDTVGPMGRSIEDLALGLQVLAGHDPADPTSLDYPVPDYRASLDATARNLTVGAPATWPGDVLSADVERAWRQALDDLAASGIEITTVELPGFDDVISIWLGLCAGDALLWHEPTLASNAADYSDGSRMFLELGRSSTALDVARARRSAHELLTAMLEAMDGVDALILPASAVPAPPIDEVAENAVRSDGRLIGGENIGPAFMMPCNVTGQPSCVVPIALSGDGLPIGLQVVGRPFADDVVLQVASLLSATSTEDFRPPRYR